MSLDVQMPAATRSPKRPSKPAAPKKSAARKRAAPGVSLAGALAEAAWTEADQALAQALADLDELETAPDEATRTELLAMLSQSLTRAARKRGLSRIGALGEREPFDPKRHELLASMKKPPKVVRIQARGVARGGEVLVKPRAGPLRRKKKS